MYFQRSGGFSRKVRSLTSLGSIGLNVVSHRCVHLNTWSLVGVLFGKMVGPHWRKWDPPEIAMTKPQEKRAENR